MSAPHHNSSAARRRPLRHRFTLVELLATVAIVAVLGTTLIRFYSNMQRSYNGSLRLAALGADARAVFSLITRDLRLTAAREDDLPDLDIKIHQPGDDQLWFVSANESGAGGGTSLLEVGYRLNETTLERAEVDDRSEDWNPYGDRDDAGNQTGYQPVIDRVLDFRITCYDQRLAIRTPNQASQCPALVGIEVTILDPKSFERWKVLGGDRQDDFADQHSRTFRKTVQIPAAQFADE